MVDFRRGVGRVVGTFSRSSVVSYVFVVVASESFLVRRRIDGTRSSRSGVGVLLQRQGSAKGRGESSDDVNAVCHYGQAFTRSVHYMHGVAWISSNVDYIHGGTDRTDILEKNVFSR